MKKKLLSTIGVTCALIMGVSMTACNLPAGEAEAESYVSLDINPSIEITLDKNDKVLSVYGANEDGQILLYGEVEDLIGVSIETAVAEITELAEALGYFDENSVVNTTVSSDNQAKEQKLFNKINAKITAKGTDLGLDLEVDQEQAFSLVRKYKEYLAESGLTEQDLPISQFKLALSASETGEVTLDAAIELDTDDLLEIIHTAHKDIKEYATREFRKIESEKKAEYDAMVKDAQEGEYINYFLSKLDFKSAFQSVGYSVYGKLARSLDAIADQVDFVEDLRFYELPEGVVTQIMTVLAIEDQTLIQDGEGKVTIASVEKYADRIIKNLDDETLKEQLSTALSTALAQAEEQVKIQAQEIINEYAPKLQQTLTTVNDVIDQMTPEVKALLGEVATEIQNATTALNGIIEEGITADALRELADQVEQKAKEMFNLMKNAITKAGTKLEEKIRDAKAEFDAHKESMNNHLNEKANEFKNHLNGLKDQYRGHEPQ